MGAYFQPSGFNLYTHGDIIDRYSNIFENIA